MSSFLKSNMQRNVVFRTMPFPPWLFLSSFPALFSLRDMFGQRSTVVLWLRAMQGRLKSRLTYNKMTEHGLDLWVKVMWLEGCEGHVPVHRVICGCHGLYAVCIAPLCGWHAQTMDNDIGKGNNAILQCTVVNLWSNYTKGRRWLDLVTWSFKQIFPHVP